VKHPGIGIKLSGTPGEIRGTSPLPGQHAGEILADLGYADDEVVRLREAGAIG
jgi:formyl-CoA transferase